MHDGSGYLNPPPRYTHDAALNAVLVGLAAQADRDAEVARRARELRGQR